MFLVFGLDIFYIVEKGRESWMVFILTFGKMIKIRSVFSPWRKKGWHVGGIKKCWAVGGRRIIMLVVAEGWQIFLGSISGSASDQKDTSPIVGLDMMDII